MNFKRIIFNFEIGIAALLTNRARAMLTSLGIIFGVASVIAMLAIGKGAEKEILEQIKQVGSNNIIIKAKSIKGSKESSSGDSGSDGGNAEAASPDKKGGTEKRNLSQGLNLADVNAISSIYTVNYCSPEIEQEVDILYNGLNKKAYIIGVSGHFFENANAALSEGRFFSEDQIRNAEPICVIGKNIKKKFFTSKNPIGEYIKCGNTWLKIIGVLDNKNVESKDMEKLAIRNINDDIFLPLTTMLLRYSNRALLTSYKMNTGRRGQDQNSSDKNYNQLDRIVVHVSESRMVSPTVEIIGRLMERRHAGTKDYEIVVPELLLKQEQKTKELFNVVLAIIASISLIVGGIGIMNIMLASILERTREIGLRLSLGATKRDVTMQFLGEAVSISVTGGIIGIILGISISQVIEKITDIHTIVSGMSIIISFSISVIIGLVFGIFPAKRAAANDPVVSLRST